MSRTSLLKSIFRFPMNTGNRDALQAKLAEHDAALDSAEATIGTGGGVLLTADATGRARMAALFFDVATFAAKVATKVIDATFLKDYAPNDVAPGVLVGHVISVPDGATGNVDVAYTGRKMSIVFAWVIKGSVDSGANANTIQVFGGAGATAITDALSINGLTATSTKLFTKIDGSNNTLSSGNTLRVTRTKAGGDVGCVVVLFGVPVA